MNLLNATPLQAGWTLGMDPSGREHVVVVAKATFLVPDDGGPAPLAPPESQVPLLYADTFTGAPGFSAPVAEADFAPRKPRCDILLEAVAHAPEGRAAARVPVGIRVGAWRKAFHAVGDRVWVQRGATPGPGEPAPFLTMPLTYDRAFGGTDDTDPEASEADRRNPVGRGFGLPRSGLCLLGRPLPNTEDPADPVTLPWGGYRPLALGPVARGWQPRLAHAGTYDQRWLDEVFPFLPADFDDRHYQAAPEDQQVDAIQGGEEVVLLNLTPTGRVGFRLPELAVPLAFLPVKGAPERHAFRPDTLSIEPGAGRLTLLWRAARPLRRDIFELAEVLVGDMGRAWWRARALGKTYYRGLGSVPPPAATAGAA